MDGKPGEKGSITPLLASLSLDTTFFGDGLKPNSFRVEARLGSGGGGGLTICLPFD
jgi:hypothetical protein